LKTLIERNAIVTQETTQETPLEPVRRTRGLPATVDDLRRKSSRPRSINDLVEAAFLASYNDPQFQAYLAATTNKEAVEGNLVADDIKAAEWLRDKEPAGSQLRGLQLWTLNKHLKSMIRHRYEDLSRKERGESLNGHEIEA
jgi:hypothetical protein